MAKKAVQTKNARKIPRPRVKYNTEKDKSWKDGYLPAVGCFGDQALTNLLPYPQITDNNNINKE